MYLFIYRIPSSHYKFFIIQLWKIGWNSKSLGEVISPKLQPTKDASKERLQTSYLQFTSLALTQQLRAVSLCKGQNVIGSMEPVAIRRVGKSQHYNSKIDFTS